jgi:hypothetical protein
MPNITIPVVTACATSNDCGRQYQVVAGKGETPEVALSDLADAALAVAYDIARGHSLDVPIHPRKRQAERQRQ